MAASERETVMGKTRSLHAVETGVSMAYRNGTYVAFHAEGSDNPTETDIKYYRLLMAWNVRDENDFAFVDSHDKEVASRNPTKKNTLRKALVARLRNSKNMILIVGDTTWQDTDWVPFEIEYAVDTCGIPIIAAYTGYKNITAPDQLRHLWPASLEARIDSPTVGVIHIPFKQDPLAAAVGQYGPDNHPKGPLTYYTRETYASWGLL